MIYKWKNYGAFVVCHFHEQAKMIGFVVDSKLSHVIAESTVS